MPRQTTKLAIGQNLVAPKPEGMDELAKGMKALARMKPVRDALEELFLLRKEMAVLKAHEQPASPDRILKLTAKIDALGRRLASAA